MDEAQEGAAVPLATRFYVGAELGWWWALSAVLGAALISFTVGASISRLLLPVAVMAVYTTAGYRLPNRNIPKLADSVYFMGFLWTLWALIDSAVLKSDVSPGGIFRVFGFALVTTASGLFLRLFLVQFHYSADDQAVEAKEELDVRVTRLRTQLEQSEQTLAAFVATVQETDKQWTATMARQVSEAQNAVSNSSGSVVTQCANAANAIASTVQADLKQVSEQLEALQSGVRGLVKGVAAASTRHERSVDDFDRRMSDSTGHLDNAISQVAARLSAMDLPPDLLKNRIEALGAGVLVSGATLKDYLDRTARDVQAKAMELDDAFRSLHSLASVGDQATAAASGLERVATLLTTVAERLPSLADGIDAARSEVPYRVETAIRQLESDVSGHRIDVARLSEEFKESSAAVGDAVKEVVDFLERRTRE